MNTLNPETLNLGARYMPQGTCPKPWVATVDGEVLRTRSGGARRYGTEEAALKAARAAQKSQQPSA